MTFVLTFLNSTWYIKNPFLKSKINDVGQTSATRAEREIDGVVGLVHEHMGLWA
jgi:ubiquitin conjugation factor E4 B